MYLLRGFKANNMFINIKTKLAVRKPKENLFVTSANVYESLHRADILL